MQKPDAMRYAYPYPGITMSLAQLRNVWHTLGLTTSLQHSIAACIRHGFLRVSRSVQGALLLTSTR